MRPMTFEASGEGAGPPGGRDNVMSEIYALDDSRSTIDSGLCRFRLSLLGTWRLSRYGVEARVSANRQRLIALLALTGPQNRAFVAGALWPDSSESQAQGIYAPPCRGYSSAACASWRAPETSFGCDRTSRWTSGS